MEQFILETFVKNYGALSLEKLSVKTGIPKSELLVVLETLKKEGFLEEEDHQYRLVREFFKVGQVIQQEKHYFVKLEEEEIPIFDTHLKHAKVGDYVFVRIQNYKTQYQHAIVEEKLQHELGEVYVEEGNFYIKIHSKVKDLKIKIENTEGLISGLMVNFEYVKELEPQLYSAKVLRIVGHKNNPNMNYQKLVTSSGIETEFPYCVIQAVGKLPTEVKREEKKGRIDLTRELIYTIDGETSKDFDDAISISKHNENYILSVHIADVSHYVKEGSIIDDEAYKRTSSVYVMGRVAPMLPYKLSNGICSLNENVDRLTITCQMEIDPQGNVLNRSVFKSVIHSKKRMAYQKVNEILKENKVSKDYEMFLESLKIGKELYTILNRKRMEEGSIEFDVPEIHFSFDSYGRPIDVYTRKRDIAERMIEEFMLVANRTVAELLKGFPAPRRVNPKPDIFILKAVVPIIELLYIGKGIDEILPILEEIKKADGNTYIEPKKIQCLLDALRKNKETSVMTSNLILSAMKRAYYTTSDDEHYALAFHDYTHFTSPIRRYSDLVVHRMIKQFLLQKDFDYDTIDMLKTKNQMIVEHISKKEKDIQRCERMIDSIKQAEYMKNHIGEEFHGYIDMVSKHGLQVCFQDVIYGKVPFLFLDGYQYDGKNKIYRNQEGDTYQLGDHISVIVENIDFENSVILLKPVKEAEKTYILR